ncbi:hypothetical protein BLA60_25425, partial [Actinophytocola xinjiangensis]
LHDAPPISPAPPAPAVPVRPSAPAPADSWPAPAQVGTPAPAPQASAPPAEAPAAQGTVDAAGIRRLWSDLLGEVRKVSRSTEAMLTNASVQSVEGDVVTIGHTAAPLARRLGEARNVEAIAKALESLFGGKFQVRCVHAEPGAAAAPAADKPKAAPTFQRPTQQAQPQQAPPEPAPRQQRQEPEAPPSRPAPAPVSDEPLPPEPPEDEDYYDAGPVPEPPPVSSPEDDMVKLLTDKLGARPIDR